jgi:hypothetical protein
MIADLAIRFALGGIIVSAFAVLGEVFGPKTFAGVFGAAPSVALASLGLAFGQSGAVCAGTSARAMIAGAIGFFAYASTCVVLLGRRIRTWVVAVFSFFAWLVVAFAAHALADVL